MHHSFDPSAGLQLGQRVNPDKVDEAKSLPSGEACGDAGWTTVPWLTNFNGRLR